MWAHTCIVHPHAARAPLCGCGSQPLVQAHLLAAQLRTCQPHSGAPLHSTCGKQPTPRAGMLSNHRVTVSALQHISRGQQRAVAVLQCVAVVNQHQKHICQTRPSRTIARSTQAPQPTVDIIDIIMTCWPQAGLSMCTIHTHVTWAATSHVGRAAG
jgi:hypothetical protein